MKYSNTNRKQKIFKSKQKVENVQIQIGIRKYSNPNRNKKQKLCINRDKELTYCTISVSDEAGKEKCSPDVVKNEKEQLN